MNRPLLPLLVLLAGCPWPEEGGQVVGDCASKPDASGVMQPDCTDPGCASVQICANGGPKPVAPAPAAPVPEPVVPTTADTPPAGGWIQDEVIYGADGTVYGCVGGGNWCSDAPRRDPATHDALKK